MLPVVRYLETKSRFDRVKKARKMKSIIEIHEVSPFPFIYRFKAFLQITELLKCFTTSVYRQSTRRYAKYMRIVQ